MRGYLRCQHFKLFEHITAAYTSLTQHHLEILLLLSILLYRGPGITGVLQHLPFPGFYRSELRSSRLPPKWTISPVYFLLRKAALPSPSLDSPATRSRPRNPSTNLSEGSLSHLSYPVKYTPWCQSSEVWTVSAKIQESWRNTTDQFKTLNTNLVTDEGAESWSVPRSYRSPGAISLPTYTTLGGERLNHTSGEVFHSCYFTSLFSSFISKIKGWYWQGMLHSSTGADAINLIL